MLSTSELCLFHKENNNNNNNNNNKLYKTFIVYRKSNQTIFTTYSNKQEYTLIINDLMINLLPTFNNIKNNKNAKTFNFNINEIIECKRNYQKHLRKFKIIFKTKSLTSSSSNTSTIDNKSIELESKSKEETSKFICLFYVLYIYFYIYIYNIYVLFIYLYI